MLTKEKGTALIWCGYFIALIKETVQPLCFLVYFILTSVSLLLLSANTISVKSAQLILRPKLVLQLMGKPHFLMCFLPNQNFAYTRNTEQYFVAGHPRAELWHWPHPIALRTVHLWGWFPLTHTSPTWITSICKGLHVWECADITTLSISQGVIYCLEAARVTYKCK